MRDASTYRGARRNACFAERLVWSSAHYYDSHAREQRNRAKRKTIGERIVDKAKAMAGGGFSPQAAPSAPRLRRAARGQ